MGNKQMIFLFICFEVVLIVSSIPTKPCPSQFTDFESGHCYLINQQKLNYADSGSACSSNRAFLPSVHNAFDNQQVAQLSNKLPIWLGGKYDGSSIVWDDGTPDNYRKWNVAPTGPGCIVLDPGTSNWLVSDCSKSYSGVCKRSAIQDCLEWRDADDAGSSIYPAYIGGIEMKIYCDMDSHDGGWTIMQNRYDASEAFWNRTWADYKNGFGEPGTKTNYWLGNEAVHQLTNQGVENDLLIELWGDRRPNSNHTHSYWWSQYRNFSLEAESSNYVIYSWMYWPDFLGNASANWYDITYSSGRPFSTIDRINDPDQSCVKDYHLGGWWLYYCAFCSLNGEYVPPIEWGNGYGMFWMVEDLAWQAGEQYQYIINPAQSRMMFRRRNGGSIKREILTNRVQLKRK